MSNNPYVSAIDPTIPVFGNPTTASVRNNFAVAKSEIEAAFGTLAPLASPVFSGVPTAPTPATADNSAAIATTAYVQAQGYPSVPVSVPHGGTGLTGGTSGGVPYYSTAGTMASSAALAARALALGGGAGAAPFTSGVWSLPAGNNNLRGDFTGGSPPGGFLTGVQVAGNTGQGAGFEGDAFAGVGYIALCRADGTPAAPTAIAGAERLAQIFGLGYDGAAYQNATALTFEARQAFSGTQRGAGLNFWGTPTGSTAIASLMTLASGGGGLSLPVSVAGGDLGQGTVNVSGGYYVGGVLRLNPPNPGTSGGIPYYSAAATLASSAALAAGALVVGGGAGVAPATIANWTAAGGTGLLRGNFMTAGTAPGSGSNPAMQLLGSDNGFPTFTMNAWGTGVGYLMFEQAGGTGAAPAATVSGQAMGRIVARGYDTAYLTNESVRIELQAAETFSATARGGRMLVWTVAAGTTTITNRLLLEHDGGLLLPNTVTGGSRGAGTLNVSSGYYIGGNSIFASPVFSGTPTAPTPAAADSSATLATTAFVKAQNYITGNQPITLSGDVAGSGTTAIATALQPNGVAAGSYQGLTIDATGRVTAAANMNYAPLASPAFLGAPTAPTTAAGDNSTALATTAYVKAQGYVTGSYLPLAGGTLTGNLAINWSGTAPPALLALQALQIVGSAGNNPGVQANGFATVPVFYGARAEGTPAAPTATAAGNVMVLRGYGYTGSAYVLGPQINLGTSQAWSGTAQGAQLDFFTTANNTTTPVNTMRLQASGSLSLPAAVTGGDTGAGTINVSGGYYRGGVAVSDPNWTFNASHIHIGNFGGSAAPVLTGLTQGLQIVGGSAVVPGVQVNAYAAAPIFALLRADGTPAAPTAIGAVERLSAIYAYGYDGSASQLVGAITFEARQAFSGTARGTGLTFFGTPNNSTTITQWMTLGVNGLGGLCLPGTVTGSDVGAGTVNVSGGYYIGGTAVSDPNWTFNASHMLIANSSGSPPPTLMINQPCLQLIGATAGTPGVQVNAIAGTASLQLLRADGTAAAPAALANADRIGQIAVNGYTGSAYSGNTGIIDFVATQAWTATANGTALEFRTTPNGATGNAINMVLGGGGLGGLSLPSTVVGGDLGVGTVNVSGGYYLGGAAALTLSGSTRQLAATTMTGALTLLTPVNPTDAATKQYVDSTSGAVGGPFLPLAGGTLTGALNVNLGGALAAASVLGMLIQGPDNPATVPGLQITRFGGTAGLQWRTQAAGGTAAAPAAITSGTIIGDWFSLGHSGSAFRTGTILRNTAAENWTATAGGANFQIITTQIGGTTQNSSTFHGNGSLLIPTAVTGGNTGAGTINVSGGYYLGGAAALTLSGSTIVRAGADIGRNRLHNSAFRINQHGFTSGTALAAAVYGHDRWKAGAGGCTYTFTQGQPATTITITAGSLQQIVEALDVEGGAYTLSWTGTAQGRVNAGAYAASPVTVTGLAANTAITVEFNTGTLGTVQLELGTTPTQYERPSMRTDLANCQRFLFVFSGQISTAFYATGAGANNFNQIYLPVPMRAPPTVTAATYSGAVAVSTEGWQNAAPNKLEFYVTAAATGNVSLIITGFTASAEL